MIVKHNEPLSQYTTFKMGGLCENLYFPENVQDLQELWRLEEPRLLLSGGSNLLINDEKTFGHVICLRELNHRLEDMGEGRFLVGASVRLQKLIQFTNQRGFGGMEYLFSVPALVGGAIVMNAGKGGHGPSISDYVERVTVFREGKLISLSREECGFGHRTSSFRLGTDVVYEAEFRFQPGDPVEFEKRRAERIELCRQKQDNSFPNFGTVFCVSSSRIMKLTRFLAGRGGKTGIQYSPKTANWLLNKGGSYRDAVKQLEKVKKLHRLLRRECRQEVIQWE